MGLIFVMKECGALGLDGAIYMCVLYDALWAFLSTLILGLDLITCTKRWDIYKDWM